MKDFEALGRYTDAAERMASLSSQRHNLAAELARMLHKASMFNNTASSGTVQVFDHAEAVKQVEKLASANEQLEAAITEMNSYAIAAEKPAVRRI
ncbi:MAG: hypothetical protein FWD62_05305 [Betaproteobacteria bacterium]|nr:hypothetical protein [Betaproteobacteria bacterium]